LKAEGEFALVKQNVEAALETAGQPVNAGTMAHDHDVYMTLADTAMQQRDAAALRQYTPRLEELAVRDGHKLYLPIAHRAWGVAHRLAGEHAKAEERLKKALELFSELDTRWQIGRTLAEMGELAQARSNAAAAREYFSQALVVFEALMALPDVERTQAALKAVG
jgi:tetratricopeptide (TPR) repeat protein